MGERLHRSGGLTASRLDVADARSLRGCSGTARLAHLGSPIVNARIRVRFRRRNGRRAERRVFDPWTTQTWAHVMEQP